MLAEDIEESVRQALREDVGTGDLTAHLIPESAQAQAFIISREAAVLCGRAWCDTVFRQVDARVHIAWQQQDGADIQANETLCTLTGPARALLTGERSALNFLQTLSGTATVTRRYVQAVAGTGAKILDTRKTLPGLRLAQKYAVTCGGGYNHRSGLYDGILIKENHILAAGSITAAVRQAKQQVPPGVMLEVEVENLTELREALNAEAPRILLDDFSLADLHSAVQETAGRAELEASGGVNLGTIRAIAESGVNYISIGGLTKNLQAVDLSMRFQASN